MSIEVPHRSRDFLLSHLSERTGRVLESLNSHPGCHADTSTTHYYAVEQVIQTMRERFDEPLSLQSMATIALLSPSHFNWVFHKVTGIAPRMFLTALRLEAAKHLILTTKLKITEICMEIGYSSVGTFTTQFTKFIGLPPRRFRHEAIVLPHHMRSLNTRGVEANSPIPTMPGITGSLWIPDPGDRLMFVGLFPTHIPQGRPVRCTITVGSDKYTITAIPDGEYYLFAAAFPRSQDPIDYLLPNPRTLRVGSSQGLVRVRNGLVCGCTNITLRPMRLTDPPISIALPLLLTEYMRLGDSPTLLAHRIAG